MEDVIVTAKSEELVYGWWSAMEKDRPDRGWPMCWPFEEQYAWLKERGLIPADLLDNAEVSDHDAVVLLLGVVSIHWAVRAEREAGLKGALEAVAAAQGCRPGLAAEMRKSLLA